MNLLSAPSTALRTRAGPLAAALLTSLAASAAAAGAGGPSSSGDCETSISRLTRLALGDVFEYLFLQDSLQLSPAQVDRGQRRQAVMQSAGTSAPAGTAKQELDVVNREAQQDMLGWEAAVVQLVQLAQAATAATCAALQQQDPPDSVDGQLICLLLGHASSLQLLPDDALPLQPPSGSSGGGAPTVSSSRAGVLHLAAVALDVMACQQQYRSRYAYLHYHHRAWAMEWVACGCTVQQLLAVLPVICPSGGVSDAVCLRDSPLPAAGTVTAAAKGAEGAAAGAAAGSSSMQFLLRAYCGGLIYWMIFYNAHAKIGELAAALGMEEDGLLRVFTHELCSSVYPLLKVPELRQQESWFRKKLPNTAEVRVSKLTAVWHQVLLGVQ